MPGGPSTGSGGTGTGIGGGALSASDQAALNAAYGAGIKFNDNQSGSNYGSSMQGTGLLNTYSQAGLAAAQQTLAQDQSRGGSWYKTAAGQKIGTALTDYISGAQNYLHDLGTAPIAGGPAYQSNSTPYTGYTGPQGLGLAQNGQNVQNAIQGYNNLIGTPGSSDTSGILATLQNTPGYQFALQQGQNSVNAQMASKGMGLSGNALAGIDVYSQGLADQTYQNAVSNAYQGISANQQGYANAQTYFNDLGQTYTSGLQGTTNLANAYLGSGSAAAGVAGQYGTNVANTILGTSANNTSAAAAGMQAGAAQSSAGLGLVGSIAGGLFSLF
jgi:hypothetical protein